METYCCGKGAHGGVVPVFYMRCVFFDHGTDAPNHCVRASLGVSVKLPIIWLSAFFAKKQIR